MIQITAGNLDISKSIISEVFSVTRSAVSQTCKRRTVEEDTVSRIYKDLASRIGGSTPVFQHIQDCSVALLQKIRLIAQRRAESKPKGAGRPTKTINFRLLKATIRAIVAEMLVLHSKIVQKVEDSSQDKRKPRTSRPLRQHHVIAWRPGADPAPGFRRLRPTPVFEGEEILEGDILQ